MMLFLCAVSFAQTEKLAIKLSARMEASKKAQQAQDAREQEKLLEVQKAKKSTAPNDPATAQTNKLKMAQKHAAEEAQNKANAALTDTRGN